MKWTSSFQPNARRQFAALLTLLAASACRDPTEARITVRTDALCADVSETSLSVGKPQQVDQAEPAAVTSACAANGRIGDLVIVPSEGKDDPFDVRVVTGLNKSADDCVRDGYVGGCIVARRSLRFLPHRSLELPILLEVACKDVPCNATQTCRHGQCVSSSVDPNQCLGSGDCDVEGAGSEAGAGGSDGADAAGAAGTAGTRDGEADGGASGAHEAGASGTDNGSAGAAPLSLCGNGVLDLGEACDDGNTEPGDGCVACEITPGYGCRSGQPSGGEPAPSVCSRVATLNANNALPDALSSDALDRLFDQTPLDEQSFMYVGITAAAPHGFEYCLARADWYATNYIANADGDLKLDSGSWQKWWRGPGGTWSAPDSSPHTNYFGAACEPAGRSLCLEWMLGGQLIGFQPAYTNTSEFFSDGYSDTDGAWVIALRVGPTRESVCGF